MLALEAGCITVNKTVQLMTHSTMRIRYLSFLAACCLTLLASAEEAVITPRFIQVLDVPREPFKYNALVDVGMGTGSASMVGRGVFATAAHVIFDDDDLVWEPIGSIRVFPRYHRANIGNPTGTQFRPVAFSRWTSYSSRVENDQNNGTPAGESTPDTFNLDFAVGYINPLSSHETINLYAEVHVDPEESVGVMRDPVRKTIVGYPTDPEFIGSGTRGLIHQTKPANYFCWWDGLSDLPQTWRDSEDFWVARYRFEGVTTYGGNSGGPLYVEDIEDRWAMAGVVVGSNGEDGVLIRGIDASAWSLIEEAVGLRGVATLRRVTDLAATATSPRSVALTWTDRSSGEAEYQVFRRDAGLWEPLEILPPEAGSYVDNAALPGSVYQYRVQPVGADGNRPPKSDPVRVETPGANPEAVAFLNAPHLRLSNSGESNWFIDGQNRLRAGQARSLGASSLRLEIIGPGTLQFDWEVSSEENIEFGNPDSPVGEDIYDALFVRLNGEPVMEADLPVFLTGLGAGGSHTLAVPEGPQTVEWVYQKDPYSDEGEDTGFLHSLSWTPGSDNPYPVFGGFRFAGSSWHGSAWFGSWFTEHFPWVGHIELGWLYLQPGDGRNLYAYSTAPELGTLYTAPELFPYLYSFAQQEWLYYYPGSGSFGSDSWFYRLSSGDFLNLP